MVGPPAIEFPSDCFLAPPLAMTIRDRIRLDLAVASTGLFIIRIWRHTRQGQTEAGGTMLGRTGTLLAAACAALVLAALPAAAQKQTLHMAYWAGPSHQMVQTLETWI